jgi:hypothetical protein
MTAASGELETMLPGQTSLYRKVWTGQPCDKIARVDSRDSSAKIRNMRKRLSDMAASTGQGDGKTEAGQSEYGIRDKKSLGQDSRDRSAWTEQRGQDRTARR